jgi:hypothetical protein
VGVPQANVDVTVDKADAETSTEATLRSVRE